MYSGGNTALPCGLHARLFHAFLVYILLLIMYCASSARNVVAILKHQCCNCSNKDVITNDILASARVFVLAGSREMFTAAEVCD